MAHWDPLPTVAGVKLKKRNQQRLDDDGFRYFLPIEATKNGTREALGTKQPSTIKQLRSLASDMYNSLSISHREQPDKTATQVSWGKHDFKCFNDLNDDVLYLIANMIATSGKTSPREFYNTHRTIALEVGCRDVPDWWLSPDLWRFRLISSACAAAGKAAWINLCIRQNLGYSNRLFTYDKLHLPPRSGNLGILRRVICDSGLGKIISKVVYHVQPTYKEEKLEENLRSVLNKDLPIKARIPNMKIAKLGAELMIRQQREQESFLAQLAQPEGRAHLKAILGALNGGTTFTVKTQKGLSVSWLRSIDDHLPGADLPALTLLAGSIIGLMSPKEVQFDSPRSTFFNVDMTPRDLNLESFHRSAEVRYALSRITDLNLARIRLPDVRPPEGPQSFSLLNAQRAVRGFNTFLGALMSLKSLEISFDWKLYDVWPTDGFYCYADMLLNGMLQDQWWVNLRKIQIEGATWHVDGLIRFLGYHSRLVTFGSRGLRVKDELETLELLKVLTQTRCMDWRSVRITFMLYDPRPHSNGELQTLVKEVIALGGACVCLICN